jgi:uncharacterized protein (DUF1800 family)
VGLTPSAHRIPTIIPMRRTEFLKSLMRETSGRSERAAALPSFVLEDEKRRLARTNSGLAPFAGAWNIEQAAHLLRRTMIGARRAEVLAIASGSIGAAVSQLTSETPRPSPPIDPQTGTTWVDLAFDPNREGQFRNYLKAWWIGLMVNQGIFLREKMVLFWHNHFATEMTVVQDSRMMYKQNALFREYALGNVKQLVREVTIDPAMLRYLNGDLNIRTRPDENYARELQELFTIGKGSQIGPGNYTNFTEEDVQEAARILTGWRTLRGSVPPVPEFVPSNHDPGNKQFSSAYANRIILGRSGADGAKELDDLLEMIFDQPETARYLCRKLYRWFVYYEIDEAVEQNVIEPLASILRANNYEVKPVIDALLKSEHFFDELNVGCFIKTPVEFVAGSYRQLIPNGAPDLTTPVGPNANYSLATGLRTRAAELQMNLMDPPDVAGWPAFYQVPSFYELWINTTTLPSRGGFTDLLITGQNSAGQRSPSVIDPIAYVATLNNPSDPWQLIESLAADLMAIPLTENQKQELMYAAMGLKPGGEYDWTAAWYAYHTPGGNTANNRTLLLRMLEPLLTFMLRMPEYQLA